jgi:hypothetical protein
MTTLRVPKIGLGAAAAYRYSVGNNAKVFQILVVKVAPNALLEPLLATVTKRCWIAGKSGTENVIVEGMPRHKPTLVSII